MSSRAFRIGVYVFLVATLGLTTHRGLKAEQAAAAVSDDELARRGYRTDISVDDAVKEFNTRAQRDPIGEKQPPLTAEEVIAAIRGWDREKEPIDGAAYEKIKKIADTGRMPRGAFLRFIPGWLAYKGYDIDVWWIDLQIGLEKNPPEEGVWDSELVIPARRIRTRFIESRPQKE